MWRNVILRSKIRRRSRSEDLICFISLSETVFVTAIVRRKGPSPRCQEDARAHRLRRQTRFHAEGDTVFRLCHEGKQLRYTMLDWSRFGSSARAFPNLRVPAAKSPT